MTPDDEHELEDAKQEIAQRVRHRFRLALVGYIVLAAGLIGGLAFAFHEIHTINRNTGAIAVFGICDMPPPLQREVFANVINCPVLLAHQFQTYEPIFENQH